jgi:hypothetical protein
MTEPAGRRLAWTADDLPVRTPSIVPRVSAHRPFVFYLAPVRSKRFEDSLSGGLLRREALQLAVLALLTAAPILFDVRALQVIAGVVDVVVAAVTAIGAVVAWRASRRAAAVGVYAVAAAVFALLAFVNFSV